MTGPASVVKKSKSMNHERRVETGLKFKPELTPSQEFLTEDGYRWLLFSEGQTGLPLIALEDLDTGVVVSTTISHPDKRISSLRAWSGARHSRAPGYSWDIMSEMAGKGVDSDARIKETVLGYGHSSPGDMAWLGVHIENVPMHFCMSVFNNLSLNGGQEKSTRYQKKFGSSPVGPLKHYLTTDALGSPEGPILEMKYHQLASLAAGFFAKHRAAIESAYREHYVPETKAHESALTARTLDTARVFLLLGQESSQFVGDTARNFSRLFGELKASPIPLYGKVAQQLERLFAPDSSEESALGQKAEAPALIRHTQVSRIVNENIQDLRRYLLERPDFQREVGTNSRFRGVLPQDVEYLPRVFTEAERMTAEYLLTIWPGLDHTEILAWVFSCPEEVKNQIAEIIFRNHDDKREFPGFTRTSAMTAIVNGSLAEVRDLNRQRSSGRFIELPLVFGLPMTADTFEQILAKGFVLPLYLTEVPEFGILRRAVVEDLNHYYQAVYNLLDWTKANFGGSIDYGFMVNLLPLSHQISIWLHLDPKSSVYTSKLRYKPGGQINYRDAAWEISNHIANSDPYLLPLKIDKRPDLGSREEFFDRG